MNDLNERLYFNVYNNVTGEAEKNTKKSMTYPFFILYEIIDFSEFKRIFKKLFDVFGNNALEKNISAITINLLVQARGKFLFVIWRKYKKKLNNVK